MDRIADAAQARNNAGIKKRDRIWDDSLKRVQSRRLADYDTRATFGDVSVKGQHSFTDAA